jgi:hypothetical protein
MDIKPMDFLLARQAVDYSLQVFGIDIEEQLYMFHIYNLALILSLRTGRPESVQELLVQQDQKFLEKISAFSKTFWAMKNQD